MREGRCIRKEEENFMNKFFRQLDETYFLKCSPWEKAGALERLGKEEKFMNKFFRQLDETYFLKCSQWEKASALERKKNILWTSSLDNWMKLTS